MLGSAPGAAIGGEPAGREPPPRPLPPTAPSALGQNPGPAPRALAGDFGKAPAEGREGFNPCRVGSRVAKSLPRSTPRPSGSPPCHGRAPPGCAQGSPRARADSESPEVQPLQQSPARSRAPLELRSLPTAGQPHLSPLPLP